MSKVNQLNFKVLAPMYFEGNYEALCERADSFGMDALTEDEQYFVDSYHRLDCFVSQLSQIDAEELENAVDNSEVYNKYSEAEMKFYENTHKVSGEERAYQAYDFLQSLERDGSDFESDYSRE